jgi:DNA-binding transcriptional LysR family regulator
MLRTLSQRSLNAFRLIVLTGSVSAAAEAIGRSQPAVSRLLKELEDEIGLRLFDRTKGRVLPTNEGMLLFEEVQRSFVGLDRIASVAGEIRSGRRGTLSVAALPTAASWVLPSVIARFTRGRPGTVVALQALLSPIVVQRVLTRECHLGLVSTTAVTPGLVIERRWRTECACIMPAGHHLEGREIIRVTDLDGEPLVSLSPTTWLGAQLDALLEQAGLDKVTRVETHLTQLSSALVLQGIGIGVVDSLTAAGHVRNGGAARPFQPGIGMEFGVVRLGDTELTAAQLQFIACCDETIETLPNVSRVPA